MNLRLILLIRLLLLELFVVFIYKHLNCNNCSLGLSDSSIKPERKRSNSNAQNK